MRGSLRNVVEMSLFGLLANHHVDRNMAPSELAQISYRYVRMFNENMYVLTTFLACLS